MDRYPPFRGGGFGPVYYHSGGPTALQWATFALVLLLTLAFFTVLVGRFATRSGPRRWGRRAFAGPGGGPRPDALEILRLRYARGEIGRDEFLRAAGDLTATPATADAAAAEPPSA